MLKKVTAKFGAYANRVYLCRPVWKKWAHIFLNFGISL